MYITLLLSSILMVHVHTDAHMSDMYGYVHASETAVGQIPANILELT